MTGWDPAATALLELLPRTARGPKRDGIFALWLTLRVARDVRTGAPALERAHRRRVDALQQRLSSLALPHPLRRALAAAITELVQPDPVRAARVLSQLVAPARETTGPDAAEAVALAAKAARQGAAT
ncbi:MAG TPA: hypothetical protein VFM14_17440 [Gemmatimonadales bacterium]|nr:hypothetical protein [Gemmatimonadales bacterium]